MAAGKECPRCGKPVEIDDRFCRACGSVLTATVSPPAPGQTPVIVCPSCGDQNSAVASLCRSCGTALLPAPPRKQMKKKKQPVSGNFFKNWKFVAGVAVLLAAAIILGKQFSGTSRTTSQDGSASHRIDSLRGVVDSNPSDAPATLDLANTLHDIHLYSQSVEMYGRYLRLQPADADARVDMGVSYFEMSFTDSVHQITYLQQARDIIQQALTYAPKHQLALFNLGVIEFHLGEGTAAMRFLTQCLAVDSTTEIAHRAKQLITQHPFTNQSPS
jgi:hypothetical protein